MMRLKNVPSALLRIIERAHLYDPDGTESDLQQLAKGKHVGLYYDDQLHVNPDDFAIAALRVSTDHKLGHLTWIDPALLSEYNTLQRDQRTQAMRECEKEPVK